MFIQWEPGFDGGFQQHFETRIKEVTTGKIKTGKILAQNWISKAAVEVRGTRKQIDNKLKNFKEKYLHRANEWWGVSEVVYLGQAPQY